MSNIFVLLGYVNQLMYLQKKIINLSYYFIIPSKKVFFIKIKFSVKTTIFECMVDSLKNWQRTNVPNQDDSLFVRKLIESVKSFFKKNFCV